MGLGVSELARGGLEFELLVVALRNPDACVGRVQVLYHRGGASAEDDFEGVTPGEGEADVGAEGGEAGLLGSGQGGGAFAFDGVANGAFKKPGVEAAFDEVVGRAGFHGLDVDFFFALAGEEDDGGFAAAVDGLSDRF